MCALQPVHRMQERESHIINPILYALLSNCNREYCKIYNFIVCDLLPRYYSLHQWTVIMLRRERTWMCAMNVMKKEVKNQQFVVLVYTKMQHWLQSCTDDIYRRIINGRNANTHIHTHTGVTQESVTCPIAIQA